MTSTLYYSTFHFNIMQAKAKVMKPPLLEGETMIGEGLHCYLLTDGRDNGLLVPADGHVFVTSYRVIFLGTPCNPQGILVYIPSIEQCPELRGVLISVHIVSLF